MDQVLWAAHVLVQFCQVRERYLFNDGPLRPDLDGGAVHHLLHSPTEIVTLSVKVDRHQAWQKRGREVNVAPEGCQSFVNRDCCSQRVLFGQARGFTALRTIHCQAPRPKRSTAQDGNVPVGQKVQQPSQ